MAHPATVTTRPPTIAELADAFAYVEAEFVIKDGHVDGEHWAEGLANARPGRGRDDRYQRVAREIYPQLSAEKWQGITARADYLRARESEAPRFSVERVPERAKTKAELDAEVAAYMAKTTASLGMERAKYLAGELRSLGKDAQAFLLYGSPVVGVDHPTGSTDGSWLHYVTFAADGRLGKLANGEPGIPWRYGSARAATERATVWTPAGQATTKAAAGKPKRATARRR